MNVRARGGTHYLTDKEKVVLEKVKNKVAMKKAAGVNPIRTKAYHIQQEIYEEYPNEEFTKWNPIYTQQVVTKCCKLLGFEVTAKHTRPLLVLEWK